MSSSWNFQDCSHKNKKSRYSNYLCNSETHRWTRINTPTGQKIVKVIEANPRNCRSVNPKSEREDMICNPASGRWVHKDGRVGQMLLKNYGKLVTGKAKPKKATKASLLALKKPKAATLTIPKLPPGYVFVKQLGLGASGQVYLAKMGAEGQQVVIKKYIDPVDKTTAEKLKKRIEKLSQIKSDYLLTYLGSYYNESTQEFYLIMDYFDGHNISSLDIKDMLLDEKLQIILQLILGLYDLHVENDVSHEDIKPSNIMINNDGTNVRYIGYGLIIDTKSWKKSYNLAGGSPYYRSPENIAVTEKTPLFKGMARASDIWSLGAVIFYILTGRHAFQTPNQHSIEDINNTILTQQPNYSLLPSQVSHNPTFMMMLKGMLEKDFQKRPDIETIVDLYEKAHKQLVGGISE